MQLKNNNFLNLKNKTAVVIGGSGLIGKQVINDFINHNAKVISLDIKKTTLKSKKNNYSKNLKYINFDCANINNFEYEYNQIINKIKRIDIFINCSYPINKNWKNSSFKEIKFDNYLYHLNSQLSLQTWIALLTAKKMKKNSTKGSIIFLSSIYGFLAQNKNIYFGTNMNENVTYSVIKGGIINLTRQMAANYGKYGIRVNCLSPGAIKGHVAGNRKNQTIKFINNYSKNCPLNRLANPNEISSVALFLASDLSTYITGQNIVVDGGWSII